MKILNDLENCFRRITNIDCIVLQNQPKNIFTQKNPFYYFLNNKINNECYGIKLDKEFNLKKMS